jgi:protein TonB
MFESSHLRRDFFLKDISVSIAIHIAVLLILPLLKFNPPMRFVEVSLIAQTSAIPQDLKKVMRKKSQKKRKVKTWTPGAGEPVPQAEISPEKDFSVSSPEINDDRQPQISDIEEEPPVEIPQPEKIIPSFGKSEGESFQISGPISSRHVLRRIYPEYPKSAQMMGISGEVVIKFWVSPDGIIEKTVVEKTSGSSVLDGAAQEAIKKWLFAPLGKGEDSIIQWGMLTVKFQLE